MADGGRRGIGRSGRQAESTVLCWVLVPGKGVANGSEMSVVLILRPGNLTSSLCTFRDTPYGAAPRDAKAVEGGCRCAPQGVLPLITGNGA